MYFLILKKAVQKRNKIQTTSEAKKDEIKME